MMAAMDHPWLQSASDADKQMHAPAFLPLPVRRYSMVEIRYRDGHSETYPSDYTFRADPDALWIIDSVGPLYRRPLHTVESISLKEVAA